MHLNEYTSTFNNCRFCGMCTHVCTVGNATGNESNTARGKGRLLFALHVGLLDFEPRAVELLYQCCTCRLCQAWCVPRIDIGEAVLAARADAVERGAAPPSAVAVRDNVLQEQNPYGEPWSSRNRWLSGAGGGLGELGQTDSQADVVYFAGCEVAYRWPEIAQATRQVLEAAGLMVAVLPDEPCCGVPLLQLGFREEAVKAASRLVERLRDSGCSTVVFSSSDCYYAIKHEYPRMGISTDGLELKHTTESIAELLDQGALALSTEVSATAVYHDPCTLGRGLEVYDPPRRVLEAVPGLRLREMHWNREKAPCCGNGGGLLHTNPDIAATAGWQTAHMVMQTRSDILVTSCALCKSGLAPHLPRTEVLDIMELVLRAL